MTEREAWLAMDARRRAKRRAQWRDSKRRRRHPDPGVVGHLHALACTGPHTWGNGACSPIPVYLSRLYDEERVVQIADEIDAMQRQQDGWD